MSERRREFFVVANSFAAPFVSDQSTGYTKGRTAAEALRNFANGYGHPAGLYAAVAYESADAYHKGAKALATWLSNHAAELQARTDKKAGFSYLGHGPGEFEIDGEHITIDNPMAGSVR